ncbi:MAG: hypothetical protein RRY11_10655 [Terrisporobacter sp.]|uniref:hypothetical protein n=1 Tax=Terrisporobacter sp. TaxID=1965305 RepID=UPI002FCA425F
MESKELLYELEDKIEKSIYLKLNYTCDEEKIINNKVTKYISNKDIEVDSSNKIKEILYTLDMGQIQLIGEYINCDTCQEYNYTKSKIDSIDGYVESTIVICKLSNNEYKIDVYMKQVDSNTNLEYETNRQYKIRLIFR